MQKWRIVISSCIFAQGNVCRNQHGKAPTAGAALRKPNPSGPTQDVLSKMVKRYRSSAKATISNVMAPKTVLLLNTNFSPSDKLCITGSPIFGFIIGFSQFTSQNGTGKNRTHRPVNPIKVMENRLQGSTEAICQTELLR
jgi:hypothetical protein